MERLTNRSTAWAVTIVVIALSVLLGARISLGRERHNTELNYYFHDINGIQTDVNRVVQDTENLLVVAGRYLQEDDPDLYNVSRSVQTINSSYSPSTTSTAAKELSANIDILNERLHNLELSEQDKVYNDKIMANIKSSFKIISQSEYNEKAEEFNATIKKFPANTLSGIVGIKPLELYEN